MIKFRKELEYSLISLSYIFEKKSLVSSREIAEDKDIPEHMLKKILQRLARADILKAVQGTKGGYGLNKSIYEISIGEIERAIFGDPFVVNCLVPEKDCPRVNDCNIRSGMQKMQGLMDKFIASVSLGEFLGLEVHT